jgi:hypothetical protein
MGFITKINQQSTIKYDYVFYINTVGYITLKRILLHIVSLVLRSHFTYIIYNY